MRTTTTAVRRRLQRLAAALSLLGVAGCGWIDWGGEVPEPRPVVAASPVPRAAPPQAAQSKRQTAAPSDLIESALPPVAGAPRSVTVGRGETLAEVARRAGVDPDALAAENGLIRPYALRPGQVLRLPAPGDGTAPSRPTARAAPAPDTEVAGLPQAPAAVSRPPAGGGFLWPVKGRLISGFGVKAGGLRNDGINIAAPRGQAVRAIAAGVVDYAGNELRGYGNLVLIRHDDDWVSAYAHADSIEVVRGERVRRGQVIARVGDTGGVSEPQLHFELRRRKKAVDPLPYLTDGGA